MDEFEKRELEKKSDAIRALAENFGKEISPQLLEMWLTLLDGYSPGQVNRACLKVLTEYEYKTIPPFAVLQKALDQIAGKVNPEIDLKQQAEAAWTALLGEISAKGMYREPELHPTTAYVLRGMGGWGAACSWKTSQHEWLHREFVSRWMLCHGNEEIMALGPDAVARRNRGIQTAGEILAEIMPQKPKAIGQCG